jgi:aryl-alcohol dehydrogenase-like predicted oxidoreductase
MEHRHLGRTGVSVSKLCLGAMMLGPWGTDGDEGVRITHAALDAGIDFIDTADVYSAGGSEEIVGRALRGRRDSVVLATKLVFPLGEDPDPNRRGGSRRWIVQAVEDSLRRLQTDHIDLYQLHRPTPETDLEETLGALSDLVHQGKIRAYGHSTYPASLIVQAQWVARGRGLIRPHT